MKILMLETMTYGDDISLEQFNRLGEVVTYSLSSYEEAVARMKEHNPDVVIINKTNMNAECMAAAPNLKMVAEAATGYNNIDTEYAKAHGIRVANVAGYSTQSVIQHTFALAFYLIEKMRYYDDFVKRVSMPSGLVSHILQMCFTNWQERHGELSDLAI